MNFNQFEINQFSGIVNSNSNPQPNHSKNLLNFDVWSKAGALQQRNGIKLLNNFQLSTLPTQPVSFDVTAINTYYSEELNQDFIIILANLNYNINLNIFNFQYSRLGIFTYPSIKKINGNYQVVNQFDEINPCFLARVMDVIRRLSDNKRMLLIDFDTNEEYSKFDNNFYYWNAIVLDADFNIKNAFLIEDTNEYDNVLGYFTIKIKDDYNIESGDYLFLHKNYVGYDVYFQNKVDKYGFIPPLINPKLVKVNNGINILSSNSPVIKLSLDFDGIDYKQYQITDSLNYITDSNFSDIISYWEGINHYDIIEIDNKKVLKLSPQNNYLIESDPVYVDEGGGFEIFLEYRKYFEGNSDLAVSLLYFDGNSWQTVGTFNASENFTLGKLNSWIRVNRFLGSISRDGQIKIQISKSEGSGYYISKIKLYKISNQNPQFYTPQSHSDYLKFNEPFKHNGFYVDKISEELISHEVVENSIKPYPVIYSPYIPAYPPSPSNQYQNSDRLLANLGGVDEQCIYQFRDMRANSPIIGKAFYVNYSILNKRIKEFRAYFSVYQTNILVDYKLLNYYLSTNQPTIISIMGDGSIIFSYTYNSNDKFENLFSYLGYEPSEGLLNSWQDQEGNYIARAKYNNKHYPHTIFYSAINGNGVVMYDTIPLANLIQIPEFGGSIRRIVINKYRTLFILKQSACYLLDIDSGAIYNLSNSDGIIADNSLATDGINIYWCDKNGVKYSDGANIINISKEINNDNYLQEQNKSSAIGYINPDYKAYEIIFDNYKIYSYPFTDPALNTIKTSNNFIKAVCHNNTGEIYYLSSSGQNINILRQTLMSENLYADYNSLPSLLYETNDFDIIGLSNGIKADNRIFVREIFIDYVSKSNFTFTLIGDNNIIATFNVPASNVRTLKRFQITSNIKNLFRAVRLRVARDTYTGGDFENLAYIRIYSVGFQYAIQNIVRGER